MASSHTQQFPAPFSRIQGRSGERQRHARAAEHRGQGSMEGGRFRSKRKTGKPLLSDAYFVKALARQTACQVVPRNSQCRPSHFAVCFALFPEV